MIPFLPGKKPWAWAWAYLGVGLGILIINVLILPAELIAENYRGIRPAPGYPACPDHTEKGLLFELLDATKNAGINLTESFAMLPAAAVSGFYFSHPEARYFAVARIDRDQAEDYARRRGVPLAEVERWLASNLAYEPKASVAA